MKNEQPKRTEAAIEAVVCKDAVLSRSRLRHLVLASEVDKVEIATINGMPGVGIRAGKTAYFIPASNIKEIRYQEE